MRAFAILVVMFGHSIILYNSSWNLYATNQVSPVLDKLKVIINTFQMPLFLAISGFCFYLSLSKREHWNDSEIWTEIRKKFVHLIIPFICVALLYMIPIRKFCNYGNWIGKNYISVAIEVFIGRDSGHLWFLPTLFYIFVICYIVLSKISSVKFDALFLLTSFACMIVSSRVPVLLFANYLASSLYWFLLGFYINKYLISKRDITNGVLYIAFAICVALGGGIEFFINNVYAHLLLEKIAVTVILILAFLIVPKKECNSVTKTISDLSMGLYLIHSPLIYITFSTIPNESPILVISINFVLFGLVSMIAAYLIKNSKIRGVIGY